MKLLFTFLFGFITFSLFAQPRKGDLFLGTSNFHFSDNKPVARNNGVRISQLTVSPEFGLMLDNHFLIGASLGYGLMRQSQSGSEPFQASSFAASAFGTYYFMQKRLTPFLSSRINISSLRSESFSRNIDAIQWNTALGLAFYVVENTALELSYDVALYDRLSREKPWLPADFRPRIGLTFRQYLFRNREGIENLRAVRYVGKGVTLLSGSGNFNVSEETTRLAFTPAVRYFFADRLYGNLGSFCSFMKARKDFPDPLSNNRFLSLNAAIGIYVPAKKNVLYFLYELSGKISRSDPGVLLREMNSFVGLDGRVDVAAAGGRAGLAIFADRHKIEPTFALLRNRATAEGAEDLVQNYTETTAALDYEFFVNKQLSFNANFSYSPRQRNIFFEATPDFTDFNVRTHKRKTVDFNFGFKWYLRGSNPN